MQKTKRYRLPLLLTGFLMTSLAYSQKVGDCLVVRADDKPIAAIVNQRRLAGEELHLYLQANERIDATFMLAASNLDTSLLRTLLTYVGSLPSSVNEDAKWCLRGHIETKVYALVAPGDKLVKDLVSSGDPSLEHLGTEVLLNQGTKEWLADRGLRRLLRAKLASEETSADVRVDILYLFGYADVFSKVRPLALKLAGDEKHPELARRAAEVVCWSMLKDGDFPALGDFFRSSTGILRQQAALTLASEDNVALVADLKYDLSSELIEMIGNKQLPPVTRGEAIEASARLRDDERVVATLLEMLDPENWFFGVAGMHAPAHSLLPVVEVLSELGQPHVKERLIDLNGQLSRLDPGDRRAVELALQKVLD